MSCVSEPYFKVCFSSPAGLNSYIMPAVCTSWAFDSDRFQLAVDCIILDFSLCTSLHLGWPCFQHVHYWLTHCLTKFYRPGFDWKTPKISRNNKMATESLPELWTFAANCLDFLCMSFFSETGLIIRTRVYQCWMSIWLACCDSQSLSSTKTLCGPSVVTMLQAAWCGHVCHIPFVISTDGGLLDGYRPETFGWCCVALESDSDLPYWQLAPLSTWFKGSVCWRLAGISICHFHCRQPV